MKFKILPTFLTIIFLIIFLIFYKGLQNPNIYTPLNNIQKEIPSFKVRIFDSTTEINSDEIFKDNKFYLVNIWASWCVPCRKEHPFLLNLNSQKNIEIIGLNYKDNNKNAKKFLNEFGNPYNTILLDNDGTIAIEWGAYGVPETFLIDRKKFVIKKFVGPINQEIVNEIKLIIK